MKSEEPMGWPITKSGLLDRLILAHTKVTSWMSSVVVVHNLDTVSQAHMSTNFPGRRTRQMYLVFVLRDWFRW